MKKIFTFIFLVVSLCVVAQKPKIAIYVVGESQLNGTLSDHLIDDIVQSGKFIATERTNDFLSALSKEFEYQQSGFVDEDEISRLGKQFGVNYVCVAAVSDVWSDKYLTARLIDVQNAEVVCSASSNGVISNSREFINALNTLSSGLLSSFESSKRNGNQKVAVYVTRTGNKDVDVILGDQLVAGFAKSGKYLAIERTNGFLNQLRKEQGYQQTGAVDDSELARWGKQFGVNYICVAKTSKVFGDYYIVSRLIDVEKNEIVNSYKVEGHILNNSQDIVEVAQDIAAHLSGRTVAEEIVYREQLAEDKRRAEEAAKLAAEEAERKAKQALIDRSWRELLKKGLEYVTTSWSSGDKYIGYKDSDDGERHGIGLYYWPDGEVYAGYFEDNYRDGYGMYIEPDGYYFNNCPGAKYYVGNWHKGKMQGTGTCYDKDGKLIYYGKFYNDKPTETYPNQSVDGWTFGVINYSDGSKYVGELHNGKRDGRGLYLWVDGDMWYGPWSNDSRSGYGIYMRYNGNWFKGTWKGDEYSK